MDTRGSDFRKISVYAVLAGLVVAVGSIQPIFNVDYWWNLAAGRWMWSAHHILRTDPFSYTVYGHRWIDFEWLFQFLLYASYRHSNVQGVLLFKAFLVLVSSLGFYSSLPKTIPPPIRALMVPATFALLRFRNMVRADLIAIALFPWFLAAYFEAMDRGRGSKLRFIWLLWAGMLIWMNSHASFWFMIALTGIFLLRWETNHQDMPHLRLENPFVLLLLGYTALLVINPYGVQLPLNTLHISLQLLTADRADFIEYTATPLKGFAAYWALVLWSAGFLALRSVRRRTWDLAQWLLFIFAVWIGLSFKRNLPFSVFVLIPLALRNLSWPAGLKRFPPFLLHAIATLLWVGLLISAARSARMGIDERLVPEQLARLLSSDFHEGRLFNDYNLGSYFIWAFYDQKRPVFIDSRMHFIEGYPELWRQLKQARALEPEGLDRWRALQQKWHFALAAMETPPVQYFYRGKLFSPFDYYFPKSEWALVYRDPRFTLFAKRSEYPSSLIAAHEQPIHVQSLPPWQDLFRD